MCSQKIRKIHRKTPVPESLFFSKNTYFYRSPLVAASEKQKLNLKILSYQFALTQTISSKPFNGFFKIICGILKQNERDLQTIFTSKNCLSTLGLDKGKVHLTSNLWGTLGLTSILSFYGDQRSQLRSISPNTTKKILRSTASTRLFDPTDFLCLFNL